MKIPDYTYRRTTCAGHEYIVGDSAFTASETLLPAFRKQPRQQRTVEKMKDYGKSFVQQTGNSVKYYFDSASDEVFANFLEENEYINTAFELAKCI